jgi:hypothetical protein
MARRHPLTSKKRLRDANEIFPSWVEGMGQRNPAETDVLSNRFAFSVPVVASADATQPG